MLLTLAGFQEKETQKKFALDKQVGDEILIAWG